MPAPHYIMQRGTSWARAHTHSFSPDRVWGLSLGVIQLPYRYCSFRSLCFKPYSVFQPADGSACPAHQPTRVTFTPVSFLPVFRLSLECKNSACITWSNGHQSQTSVPTRPIHYAWILLPTHFTSRRKWLITNNLQLWKLWMELYQSRVSHTDYKSPRQQSLPKKSKNFGTEHAFYFSFFSVLQTVFPGIFLVLLTCKFSHYLVALPIMCLWKGSGEWVWLCFSRLFFPFSDCVILVMAGVLYVCWLVTFPTVAWPCPLWQPLLCRKPLSLSPLVVVGSLLLLIIRLAPCSVNTHTNTKLRTGSDAPLTPLCPPSLPYYCAFSQHLMHFSKPISRLELLCFCQEPNSFTDPRLAYHLLSGLYPQQRGLTF